MGDEDLIEVLRHGVPAFGLHEDNSTELFDIEAANEVMTEAADRIEALQADVAELEGWKAAEDAHHHALKARIAQLEAELAAAREAMALVARNVDWVPHPHCSEVDDALRALAPKLTAKIEEIRNGQG